jgi:hypothetical protein
MDINEQLRHVKLHPFHDDEVCFPEAARTPPHIEVASNTEAMEMALQEWYVRQMFEHGAIPALTIYAAMFKKIGHAAIKEFLDAPINKRGGNCV